MTKCIDCKQDKDTFSEEWDYKQCEPCSINQMNKEECIMCGDTATHFESTTTKAACCKCWGDCSHG